VGVTPKELKKVDKKLTEFLDYITDGMGRPERREAMSLYLTGLLLSGGRKTAVGMGRRLATCDDELESMRQRLQQCVSISNWADEEVRRRLALRFEEQLEPEAFIVDDTGFPKKGKLSVGVKRQYSGTLGRTDNCQVAPSLHVANNDSSGCIGMRLYLPEDWASDVERRRSAGIPDDVVFKKKWEIALDLLDDALGWGLAPRIVLGDSAFGDATEFRDALDERGCPYLVGISGDHLTWPPGSRPHKPRRKSKTGRPPTQFVDGKRKPLPISEVGEALNYRKVTVQGSRGSEKSGYFAFERVHLAERHTKGRPPSEEVWLICEWRPAKREHRYYVCNLPASTTKRELVRLLKLRWRIERDYQEMKQEIGLDHFEGRTWRGFHHHVTLCAVAHGFLAIQRQLFPPEDLPMDPPHGPKTNSAPAAFADR
jgi:SRSO17 transposase